MMNSTVRIRYKIYKCFQNGIIMFPFRQHYYESTFECCIFVHKKTAKLSKHFFSSFGIVWISIVFCTLDWKRLCKHSTCHGRFQQEQNLWLRITIMFPKELMWFEEILWFCLFWVDFTSDSIDSGVSDVRVRNLCELIK